MEHYVELGYLGLFVARFLAATVIPLSSEVVLSLLIANEYDFVSCLSIATLGNWLGGISSFGLGYIGNWQILERFFRIKQEKVGNLRIFIKRWGSPLAFLCWLPLVGDVFAVGLGFFKIDFKKVALWMLVGKMLRYSIWGTLTLWGISLF
jgi:membrane protein YqaA with SNARE-associated domain